MLINPYLQSYYYLDESGDSTLHVHLKKTTLLFGTSILHVFVYQLKAMFLKLQNTVSKIIKATGLSLVNT